MLQLFKIIHAEVFKFLVIFWAIKEQVLYSPETDPDPKPISWAPGCGFTHRLPPWCYQSVNFVSAETVMWDMAALWQVWSRHCSVHSRVGRFPAEQNGINKLQWEILVLFILIVNIAEKKLLSYTVSWKYSAVKVWHVAVFNDLICTGTGTIFWSTNNPGLRLGIPTSRKTIASFDGCNEWVSTVNPPVSYR